MATSAEHGTSAAKGLSHCAAGFVCDQGKTDVHSEHMALTTAFRQSAQVVTSNHVLDLLNPK